MRVCFYKKLTNSFNYEKKEKMKIKMKIEMKLKNENKARHTSK